jgi:hypothetical protein
MPNCSPHSLHETISVFGRWATSLWLSFTATGHKCSPGLNVFLYSSGISSITPTAVKCYHICCFLSSPNARPRIVTTPRITMPQGNADRAWVGRPSIRGDAFVGAAPFGFKGADFDFFPVDAVDGNQSCLAPLIMRPTTPRPVLRVRRPTPKSPVPECYTSPRMKSQAA